MGIIIELLIEGIAWILFEVLGELIGEGISSAFGRKRSRDVVVEAPPGSAPPPGQGVILGPASATGAPAPPDGSGWGAPGSTLPGEAPPAAMPPQAPVPPQPQAPVAPATPSQPQVQAAVQVDASGCATWVFGLAMVIVMGGVGFWWGQRRHGIDPNEMPATLWVGIGLATLCFVLALVRVIRQRSESEVVGPPLAARAIGHGWQGALLPWRWTAGRLVVFGLANVALAAGVALGFQQAPDPPVDVPWRSHDRFGTVGFGDRLPNAALTGLQAVGAVVVLGVLAATSNEEFFLFGALGATTFLQLANPLSAPASPRNTVVGHGVACAAALTGVAIFGLWGAGPAADSAIGADRIAAVAFALGTTIAVLIAFDRQHLAAGASTVVIALGEVDDYFISGLGVLVLTAYSFATNRLRGIPYPRWAPHPPDEAAATPPTS